MHIPVRAVSANHLPEARAPGIIRHATRQFQWTLLGRSGSRCGPACCVSTGAIDGGWDYDVWRMGGALTTRAPWAKLFSAPDEITPLKSGQSGYAASKSREVTHLSE